MLLLRLLATHPSGAANSSPHPGPTLSSASTHTTAEPWMCPRWYSKPDVRASLILCRVRPWRHAIQQGVAGVQHPTRQASCNSAPARSPSYVCLIHLVCANLRVCSHLS